MVLNRLWACLFRMDSEKTGGQTVLCSSTDNVPTLSIPAVLSPFPFHSHCVIFGQFVPAAHFPSPSALSFSRCQRAEALKVACSTSKHQYHFTSLLTAGNIFPLVLRVHRNPRSVAPSVFAADAKTHCGPGSIYRTARSFCGRWQTICAIKMKQNHIWHGHWN